MHQNSVSPYRTCFIVGYVRVAGKEARGRERETERESVCVCTAGRINPSSRVSVHA